MPVDFLNNTQSQWYGQYPDSFSETQLACYFHLDDFDMAKINSYRGEHNRLGFAMQLVTVRFLGMFIPDPTAMPKVILQHISKQLDVSSRKCLPVYIKRKQTWHTHRSAICELYGYREFGKGIWGFSFVRWLYMRSWYSNERPGLLFDLSVAWLTERKILLPGITTLTRLISSIRERASIRLWKKINDLLSDEQCTSLEKLLKTGVGKQTSQLDMLRQGPTKVSGPELVSSLHRYDTLRSIGIGSLNVTGIPLPRLQSLGKHAATSWAAVIARMPDVKRRATLVAFVYIMETVALDDALDLLDMLITEIVAQAVTLGKKERLRTLKDLDKAALLLMEACSYLLDHTRGEVGLRKIVFEHIPEDVLQNAIKTVVEIARPVGENYNQELSERYGRIRRFLPSLLRYITFRGNKSGEEVLKALHYIAKISQPTKHDWHDAPMDVVSKSWLRLIYKRYSTFNYQAYTLCVLERLQDSLRRRDIFVEESNRWNDPRKKLLSGLEWQSKRLNICRMLGLPSDAKEALTLLGDEMDGVYKRVAKRFPDNQLARLSTNEKGRGTFILTPLDSQDEPDSLIELRNLITSRLPKISMPEILLEVHLHTGFANAFTHVSENNARATDMSTSICAVLLAEACNIGLEPLLNQDDPSLTRDRLGWAQQNYIRTETLAKANACLVDYQTKIQLVSHWGNGEVASADGLRFVVPVNSVNARPNRKYFREKKGITWYNFLSDMYSGFHGIVISGTLRDSIYILEGLLEQQSSIRPTQIMADTAASSDVIFGLFSLLGYQFSPRLADIGNTRLWRMDDDADYSVLNELARHKINDKLIATHWEDMLQTAGSLQLGSISASELIKALLKTDRPSSLTRAIAELGRISKTIHILNCIDDENYRRNILIQLNRTEARHSLARAICHGHRGEIRKRYRDGQEDQLGALGLVTNAVVLWNTMYIEAIIKELREEGYLVKAEDIARISPLEYGHINMLGQYFFILSENVASGKLRPLRNNENIYAKSA